MAVNERARHDLYEAMRDALGAESAETLMEMLPPVGWFDVATKQDVVLLKQDLVALRSDMATKADLSDLRGFVHSEVNKLILWFVPFNIGLAFAAARLG